MSTAPPNQQYMSLFELKQHWKSQQEKGNFRQKKLVDVIIPAYKEEGIIERTLDKMMNQTMWKQGLMNIVVGEYSVLPAHLEGKKTSYLRELCKKNKLIHVFVPEKGVGYARNYTILNGSVSDVICNFDADSQFNRTDAVELMLAPINKDKRIVCTYCQTVVVPDEKLETAPPTLSYMAYQALLNNAVHLEKIAPIGRAIGLTMTREAFFKVNGFPHYKLWEDYTFHYRISVKFGMWARKFVDDVKVLSSDRRVRAINKEGISVFDYSNNYR